jgi:hypothetical protein
MTRIIPTIVALILVTSALAPERLEGGTRRNVRTYDVPTLLKEEPSLLGKTVAVRFHYRSEKLRHLQPNWYEASIWQHDPKAKNGFSALRVMVETNSLADFQSITSDFNSMTEVTIYGTLEKDPDNNLIHLRFIGREDDGSERHRR